MMDIRQSLYEEVVQRLDITSEMSDEELYERIDDVL